MIKVLDLFAGTQSVRKALEKMNIEFEYKGVDIYSPEGENIILDLTQNNIIEKLKEKLNGWEPDFVWASPVCTPFSRTITINGGTISYVYNKETQNIRLREYREYELITHKNVKHSKKPDWINKNIEKGISGLKMFENTKLIINHFNKPFAIENPANALSQYILKEYVRNVCNYCMYGFEYKKSTAIYSSKLLNLKKCNHKIHLITIGCSLKKTQKAIKFITERTKELSRVPEQLIINILKEVNND